MQNTSRTYIILALKQINPHFVHELIFQAGVAVGLGHGTAIVQGENMLEGILIQIQVCLVPRVLKLPNT